MFFYLKKSWKISLLVCFFQICVWGMQAVVQIFLMKTFGSAIALDLQGFFYWTFVNLIAWGIYFLFGVAQGYFQSQAIRKLNNQVRHNLYLSLLNKNYEDYNEINSGEYLSWLTNNIRQIENLAWNPFFNGVGRIAQILWSMLALALIDWTLLLASLATALIMWFVPKIFEKKMQTMEEENRKAQAKAVGNFKDLLSGLDVLRLFGKKSLFLEKGDNISNEVELVACNLNHTKNKIESVLGFLNISLQVISQVIIMLLVFAKRINIAVMGGGSNLISGVTNGFNNILNFRLSIASSKPYFDNISGNIEEIRDIKEREYKLRPIKGDILLENIGFAYGEKTILNNINMQFKEGGKYALVGPSGCGKTTLLKIVLGWLPDYTGTIRFDGLDAKEYSLDEIQGQISYIEQDVFLFNTTIKNNITLNEDFPKSAIEKVIKDSSLINDLKDMPKGLDTLVGEGGKNLSGGQKQRIAIARALLHKHSILLVDEGTSGLDRENADIVEESLLKNPEITLILISHHLTSERRNQFDHVYELK